MQTAGASKRLVTKIVPEIGQRIQVIDNVLSSQATCHLKLLSFKAPSFGDLWSKQTEDEMKFPG